jgi:arylsulfatase A-like enzyme
MAMDITRRAFLGTAAASVGAAAAWGAAQGTARPPNVVYIICDQMRADALGYLGNPNAHTPHLDRLAAQGVCCTRWFSNNPVCAPSRATAFTGMYPHEHGRTTNHDGAPPGRLEGTLCGHFAERGYRLGWVGKNHTYAEAALRRLDYYRPRGREPFRDYPPQVPPWWHSSMYWPEDACHASLNTRDAVEFLDAQEGGQPFFLHVSYFDPHPPYFAPAAAVEAFGQRDMRLPETVPPERLSQRLADYARAMAFGQMSDASLRQTMRHYHAAIAWGVDAQVGALVEALEARGLLENTVLLFTSDHGDFMGDHHMVRKGMFHYDALLHVPMIWYAPGRIEGGRQLGAEGSHVDLFPTLAELTGAGVPEGLSGRSYAGVLLGETPPDEARPVHASATYGDLPTGYFDDPERLDDPIREQPLHKAVMDLTMAGTRRTAMVRTRDWKFIRNETGGNELYALSGGVLERENVAGTPAHEAVQAALLRQTEEFWPWP